FFQAEDGIRDWSVTGVQTCALPISNVDNSFLMRNRSCKSAASITISEFDSFRRYKAFVAFLTEHHAKYPEQFSGLGVRGAMRRRSEERRVGKECRSGWAKYH